MEWTNKLKEKPSNNNRNEFIIKKHTKI